MKQVIITVAKAALGAVKNKYLVGLGLAALALVGGVEASDTDMAACTNLLSEILVGLGL